ncbi:uncharacterized protein GGS22DRAFT_162972 [Annulohypoxylon maeteangense]|uniref:uncharacterized protein n=1 Tax=Annulohypoxylon maeteangense TaxID=1927788 RepID=UPI0020079374|nr:uncharacterized protein GGS22DRAFT_162972 [Annulohypoxylon maeteangense]KAI0885177.1 hypothetical protein GGS22DRAFT_162972 [Annulohypoxylon maeteangense]
MGSVLSEKDVNVPVQAQDAATANNNGKPSGAKALEYHRQMLQSKMADEKYEHYAKSTNCTNAAGTTGNDVASPPVQNPRSRLLANMNAALNRHQQYISPSDSIMSPATAKLNALKGRVASRIKPKSLFAQTSAKKLDGSDVFGSKGAKGPQDRSQDRPQDSQNPPTEDQRQPDQ